MATRRRPRATDVAARAGVSQTTVSLVLNGRDSQISEPTRLRVMAAAEALGYHGNAAARQLASRRTRTVGLVVRQSSERVAGDAFLGQTLQGISVVTRAAGYRVVVEPDSTPDAATYSSLALGQHVDALIVSGPRTDDEELASLVSDGFPVVVHGSRPDLAVPSVDIDNAAAARLAVATLIEAGHRRIACVVFGLEYTAARERLDGYLAALGDERLDTDLGLIVESGYDAADARRSTADLLDRADFTGLFVAYDVGAAGALGALRAAGLRVPEDISVVGIDDIPLAEFFDPPLTTVRVPAYEIGTVVGRTIIDCVAGRDVQQRTVLPVRLISRSSVAPPRDRR